MSAVNILLVDDNRNLVITLSEGLRKAMGNAISVLVCFSGSEALAMLPKKSFDVVICESDLPGESGLGLLDKIQQNYPETSLVLVTTYGTAALEDEVHRHGIGYLPKPFGIPLLVQTVHDLLRDKEKKEETESPARILTPEPESGKAGMP